LPSGFSDTVDANRPVPDPARAPYDWSAPRAPQENRSLPQQPAEFDRVTEALSSALEALPWGASAIALVALGAGLLLWLRGRGVVRPAFAIGFAAFFGALGFYGPPAVGLDIDPHLGLGVGLVLGALLGLVMFRFAMAVMLGATLGLAAPLIAGAVLRLEPTWLQPREEAPTDSASQRFLPGEEGTDNFITWSENILRDLGVPLPGSDGAERRDTESPEQSENETTGDRLIKDGAERVRVFLRALGEEARTEWNALSASERWILTGSAVLGVLTGFLAGLARPKHVAALVTGFAGAAMWLPALAFLMKAHDLPGTGLLPGSPLAWLLVWCAVALVGALSQWTILRRRADKPQSR